MLRHACAGKKHEWGSPDARRPLDDAGREQAGALGDLLEDRPITRLACSPSQRCRQTLIPLADRTGLPIEDNRALKAEAPAAALLEFLSSDDASGGVYCTHGEALERLLPIVRDGDVRVLADRSDDEWLLLKGSAWDLLFVDGRIRELRHRVPVPISSCPSHLGD